jgi:cytochrome c oxidase subunit 2
MLKKLLLLSMVAAFVLIMAACGSNNTASTSDNGGDVQETGAAASQELVIKATDWQFDKTEYTIKKGEATNITVQTDGIHGIEIPDLGVNIAAGKSQVVTFKDAGTYQFHCDVMCGTGHSKMIATIKVE